MKLVEKQKFFCAIIFCGFVVGILYTNLVAIDYLTMTGIFNGYYLSEFANQKFIIIEYLPRIIWNRLIPLMVVIVLAYSKLHKVIVIGLVMWVGFLWGIFMSLGIAQLGMFGIVVCIVSVMPQIVFYIPTYLIVGIYGYQYPNSSINMSKIIVGSSCFVMGIVMECQVNPYMLKWIINIGVR